MARNRRPPCSVNLFLAWRQLAAEHDDYILFAALVLSSRVLHNTTIPKNPWVIPTVMFSNIGRLVMFVHFSTRVDGDAANNWSTVLLQWGRENSSFRLKLIWQVLVIVSCIIFKPCFLTQRWQRLKFRVFPFINGLLQLRLRVMLKWKLLYVENRHPAHVWKPVLWQVCISLDLWRPNLWCNLGAQLICVAIWRCTQWNVLSYPWLL